MIDSAAPGTQRARGAPLLVTAELPEHVFLWADGLRREHYPPDRNRLGAHVTLFHALPPSAEGEVRRLLAEMATEPAPEALVTGVMDLGQGSAFAVDSPDMVDIHGELADRLRGLIQQKDAASLRLHITVQNKVPIAEARALQMQLAADFVAMRFRFRGLALSQWRDEKWHRTQLYPFRGRR